MSSTRTDLGARVLTYAELLAREGDEETRRELLEGELHAPPAPNLAHQRVVRNLGFLLHQHVSAHALGEVFLAPTDVVLDEHDVVQPDVLFVAAERARIVAQGKNVAGPPDLVVEVVSPSRPADGGAPERARAGLAGGTQSGSADDGSSREAGERSRRTHHTVDLGEELIVYQRSGVRHDWLLDPADHALLELVAGSDGRFEARTRLQGPTTFTPAVFPDLVLPLGDVWA